MTRHRISAQKHEIATCENISPFAIRLPDEIVAPADWTATDLVHHVFPQLNVASRHVLQPNCASESRAYFCDRAILTTTNAIVDEINEAIMQEFDPQTHVKYCYFAH